jgi:hypothetical protein
MKSVLQDWVMELPLREQGVLLTGIRGCDLTPKLPLDSAERQLVGWIRNAVMNPADPREVGIRGAFFQTEFPKFKWSQFGHYPLHWVVHVAHCLQVIGYRHPSNTGSRSGIGGIGFEALNSYFEFCHSLHLIHECKISMIERLSEDRIKTNTVVS